MAAANIESYAGAPADAPGMASSADRREMRKVIIGSSLGTVFEWYDFFLYGTLAGFFGPLFFSPALGETGAFLASLATYGAGLVLRPFGSLLFGRMGDTAGRKMTFLITVALMGIATAGVGLIPTFAQIGIAAPIILVTLRCLQGLAMGGEYGGAATYVAEHAVKGRSGRATGWIQICASGGFFLSLLAVFACRGLVGADEFRAWGWRLPFVASVALLAISMFIRARLHESPVFKAMKAEGKASKAPVAEAYGVARWRNLMLLSLFGCVAGVGVVWYAGQFYALFFLQKVLKVDFDTATACMAVALALATPFFVLFGALSDRIGRKPIIMGGMLLAAVTYFPLFGALTHYANPILERATAAAPVVIRSNDCHLLLLSGPQTDCERVRELLNVAGVTHRVEPGEGAGATTQVGTATVTGYDAPALTVALRAAGYPAAADPAQVNTVMVTVILFVMVLFVCITYGPVAIYLVELFPARIRYTALSMPYHIGTGYFGGFMLYFATLISTTTGNIYGGLWYAVVIAVASTAIGLWKLPETLGRDIRA
ncbi:General substrate transporter (plasmid) [Methylobacterium nodulans ORS 2060]|uniref:General substrate transporter n=2 Tax=Methylobacterium nodulans TaxID=114616 RepID=B8IW34_METNO|nr:General substrate transporter [Methylobacterium nodulans ORS 2060]